MFNPTDKHNDCFVQKKGEDIVTEYRRKTFWHTNEDVHLISSGAHYHPNDNQSGAEQRNVSPPEKVTERANERADCGKGE